MRWIVCVSFGVVAVLMPVSAAPRLKNPARPPIYSATAVGTEWVYAYRAGIDTSRVKRTLVRTEERDRGVLVSIDREWDGKTVPDSRVLVSADGLLALPVTGKDGRPPVRRLKSPVVRGQSWELPREGWDPPAETYVVRGIETVEVPAGTFQAVRVDFVESRGGVEQSRTAYWYAREVGLVKRTNFAEFGEVLVSFKPGPGGAAAPSPATR